MKYARRDPDACLRSVVYLQTLPNPSTEAARKIRGAELSRAIDELFAALYCDSNIYKSDADVFVRNSEVVALMTSALEQSLPWPYRMGVIDHAAGLLDNFFARKLNYDVTKHQPVLGATMHALDQLVKAQITNGLHAQLESALESVLLLLGRLLARASEPQLSEAEAIELAHNVVKVLIDANYEEYVHHVTLYPLQQLLTCPKVGIAVRSNIYKINDVVWKLQNVVKSKHSLSYGLIVSSMTSFAALRDGSEGTHVAQLRQSEAWREDLLAYVDFSGGNNSDTEESVEMQADAEPAEMQADDECDAADAVSSEALISANCEADQSEPDRSCDDVGFVLPSRSDVDPDPMTPKKGILNWLFSK